MFDIDNGISFSELKSKFSRYPGCLRVHRTKKGWHVFDVTVNKDSTYIFNDTNIHVTMNEYGCDAAYTKYVSCRGWSVRLNRKHSEDIQCRIYQTDYDTIGTTNDMSEILEREVQLIVYLSMSFQNTDASSVA